MTFIENTMKNWRVEVTAGGKSLAEVQILRGIFQVGTLSPLLSVIAMMRLNHIGYLNKQPSYVHERHQIVYQKYERTGNPNIRSDDIQWRHRDRIRQRKMCHTINEKQKNTNDGRNSFTKSRKNQNARRKENLQILENCGSWHHQKIGGEIKKVKKNAPKERENYSQPSSIEEI